ncbi:DedA family protein [Candidatus Magnetaquicoccus inordinatus]|uniref:DedA family protein n=1 Tax=Candidatus Magnetaquicoccus inordinatus TaxID=2496818 RepID=UPI00102BD0A2|nr:DedA family protein [Candidatus Magnetaquicoccus inordinatus]
MSAAFTQYLLDIVGQMDYLAIFLLMAAESSILPVPSELVMIPAGYLLAQGKLSLAGITLASSLGSLAGSLGSYWLALWLGRPLLLRYGRFFLITPKHLKQTERFMARHGEISIFTGRFVPGVRHLISMPAGLARMSLLPFLLFTGVGSTLWNLILLALGYLLHEQQNWLEQHLSWIAGGALLFATTILALYLLIQRSRRKSSFGEA